MYQKIDKRIDGRVERIVDWLKGVDPLALILILIFCVAGMSNYFLDGEHWKHPECVYQKRTERLFDLRTRGFVTVIHKRECVVCGEEIESDLRIFQFDPLCQRLEE